nr:hypothetical protein [Trentepohlia sp. YN1242]
MVIPIIEILEQSPFLISRQFLKIKNLQINFPKKPVLNQNVNLFVDQLRNSIYHLTDKNDLERQIIYFINPLMLLIDKFVFANRFYQCLETSRNLRISSFQMVDNKPYMSFANLSIKITKTLFFDASFSFLLQDWSTNFFLKPLPKKVKITIQNPKVGWNLEKSEQSSSNWLTNHKSGKFSSVLKKFEFSKSAIFRNILSKVILSHTTFLKSQFTIHKILWEKVHQLSEHEMSNNFIDQIGLYQKTVKEFSSLSYSSSILKNHSQSFLMSKNFTNENHTKPNIPILKIGIHSPLIFSICDFFSYNIRKNDKNLKNFSTHVYPLKFLSNLDPLQVLYKVSSSMMELETVNDEKTNMKHSRPFLFSKTKDNFSTFKKFSNFSSKAFDLLKHYQSSGIDLNLMKPLFFLNIKVNFKATEKKILFYEQFYKQKPIKNKWSTNSKPINSEINNRFLRLKKSNKESLYNITQTLFKINSFISFLFSPNRESDKFKKKILYSVFPFIIPTLKKEKQNSLFLITPFLQESQIPEKGLKENESLLLNARKRDISDHDFLCRPRPKNFFYLPFFSFKNQEHDRKKQIFRDELRINRIFQNHRFFNLIDRSLLFSNHKKSLLLFFKSSFFRSYLDQNTDLSIILKSFHENKIMVERKKTTSFRDLASFSRKSRFIGISKKIKDCLLLNQQNRNRSQSENKWVIDDLDSIENKMILLSDNWFYEKLMNLYKIPQFDKQNFYKDKTFNFKTIDAFILNLPIIPELTDSSKRFTDYLFSIYYHSYWHSNWNYIKLNECMQLNELKLTFEILAKSVYFPICLELIYKKSHRKFFSKFVEIQYFKNQTLFNQLKIIETYKENTSYKHKQRQLYLSQNIPTSYRFFLNKSKELIFTLDKLGKMTNDHFSLNNFRKFGFKALFPVKFEKSLKPSKNSSIFPFYQDPFLSKITKSLYLVKNFNFFYKKYFRSKIFTNFKVFFNHSFYPTSKLNIPAFNKNDRLDNYQTPVSSNILKKKLQVNIYTQFIQSTHEKKELNLWEQKTTDHSFLSWITNKKREENPRERVTSDHDFISGQEFDRSQVESIDHNFLKENLWSSSFFSDHFNYTVSTRSDQFFQSFLVKEQKLLKRKSFNATNQNAFFIRKKLALLSNLIKPFKKMTNRKLIIFRNPILLETSIDNQNQESQSSFLSFKTQTLYNKKNTIFIAALRYFNLNDRLHLIHKVNYSVENFEQTSFQKKMNTYTDKIKIKKTQETSWKERNYIDDSYVSELPISLSKLLNERSFFPTVEMNPLINSKNLTQKSLNKPLVSNVQPFIQNLNTKKWFQLFESNAIKSVKNRDLFLSKFYPIGETKGQTPKIKTNLIHNAYFYNYSNLEWEQKKWQISHSSISGVPFQTSMETALVPFQKRNLNESSEIDFSHPTEISQNEYIQIDIWTNGSLSPRQSLLNAFKKLFEIFYTLSKDNFIKPIGF